MRELGAYLEFYEDGRTITLPIDSVELLIDDSGSNDAEFSWDGCECCFNRTGKHLGNSVYRVKVYPSLEHAQRGEYWEKALCADCLYEHHYGVGSVER